MVITAEKNGPLFCHHSYCDVTLIRDLRVMRRVETREPLQGAASAQKAFQGSETETRELLGGTTENSVSPVRGHLFAIQANQCFFTKRKQEKN